MGLPRKFNTWRKRGGVWKRLVHSWLPRLSWNLRGSYWSSYTLMAGILADFGPNSQTIPHVWPTRCGTDGFFHFSICCSNCLGWYWGRQRSSWIRKTVMVFSLLKKFRACNFRGYWQPRKFFNSENFPIYGTQPSLHCYYNFPGGFCSELRLVLHQWWVKHIHSSVAIWLSLTYCDSNFNACYWIEHMSTCMCDMVPNSW